MKCNRFHDHLNEFLNGNTGKLPRLAERHKEECPRCERLHQTLISLQSVARQTPAHKLSRHSEKELIARIRRKEGRTASFVPAGSKGSVSNLVRGLRWEPILLVGGLVTASVALFLRFSEPKMPEPASFRAEAEVQELLDEHARATDSGIFHGTYQYANIATATDEK